MWQPTDFTHKHWSSMNCNEVYFRNERISADENLTTFQRFGLQKRSVTIAAFNIQVFGDSKYSKKDVVDVILKVRQTYDVLFIPILI